MKRALSASVVAFLLAASAKAATFTYTQTDATTGSGTIAPFTINDGGGDINFSAVNLPSATVVNPGPGQFVGRQTVASGASNENNSATGLTWSGFVTATGTRGSDIYTVQIPLKFVPKVTQTPDVDDYTWSVAFGDNSVGGQDTTSSVNPRFAMWFSRDDVVDAIETPDTFQRYTQQTHAFIAGQDNFTNTNLTVTTGTPPVDLINDATDPVGAPAGVDAAGRNLAFYFGWRDQGTVVNPAFTVDTFTVGGLLNPDTSTLTLQPVPEPGIIGLAGIAMLGMIRRRRAAK